MKKSLIILLALFLLSSAVGICGFASVNTTADMVDIREIIREGDASAAEGLSMKVYTNYDYHLFWETPFRAGESGLRESAFRSSVKQDYGTEQREYRGIYLSSTSYSPGHMMMEEYGAQLTGMGRAYYELFLSLAPGAEAGRHVRVKDYLDYYPIEGNMDLPGFDMIIQDPLSEWLTGELNNSGAWQKLNDYFRIPVLEEEIAYISLGKDESGNVNRIGGGTGSSENYNFWIEACLFPEAVYFTINNRSSLDDDGYRIMDTSLIPGGYGIYRLPCESDPASAVGWNIDFDGLETVKPLDEELQVNWMIPDINSGKLIIIGSTDGESRMYVIDEKTMETEQELILDTGDKSGVNQIFNGGDYLVFVLSGNRLALAERQSNGDYVLRFKLDGSAYYEQFDLYRVADTAWDGKRLALCGFKGINYPEEYFSGDFFYAVYDETGLICFADCDSSLCINSDEQWDGVHCGHEPKIELSWDRE